MIPDYHDIVFVNGCFDVLHHGHVKLLEYARSLGSALVVALDSDERVASRKAGRPIHALGDRMGVIAALRCVDRVASFGSDEELEALVKYWRPRYMVVGSDWEGKNVIGSDWAREVRFFTKYSGLSSTRAIEAYK